MAERKLNFYGEGIIEEVRLGLKLVTCRLDSGGEDSGRYKFYPGERVVGVFRDDDWEEPLTVLHAVSLPGGMQKADPLTLLPDGFTSAEDGVRKMAPYYADRGVTYSLETPTHVIMFTTTAIFDQFLPEERGWLTSLPQEAIIRHPGLRGLVFPSLCYWGAREANRGFSDWWLYAKDNRLVDEEDLNRAWEETVDERVLAYPASDMVRVARRETSPQDHHQAVLFGLDAFVPRVPVAF